MLDKTKPIFDSREAETFDLYDSSDDYGMANDIDVNEVVDEMEAGILELGPSDLRLQEAFGMNEKELF